MKPVGFDGISEPFINIKIPKKAKMAVIADGVEAEEALQCWFWRAQLTAVG